MINVLIVDDSSFMRRSLASILTVDPEINIIAQATNGEEAVRLAKELDPDVITMDIEMPRMDGLTALQKIMAENPCPIIMVSSLTSEGAESTLKALELGALDYMPKISSSMMDMALMQDSLAGKVKALAKRKAFMRLMHRHKQQSQALSQARPASSPPLPGAEPKASSGFSITQPSRPMPVLKTGGVPLYDVIAIGVSTGGPPAVQKILSSLPEKFPVPIVIAQHMPAAFTKAFAARLDSQSKISVKEADPIENLKPATAYICPGGKHLRVEYRKGSLMGIVTDEPKEALYKPSATVLMETAGMAAGRRAFGVMLTGMGSDGLEGTKILKAQGGRTLAQSENSCVVYGMPKAIVDAGLADEVVDLEDIAATIVAHIVK